MTPQENGANASFERRIGQMLLAQILYPFATALREEGLTTASVPDMLTKKIYKIMKVTTLEIVSLVVH